MQRTHHIQSGGRESGDEPPPTHVIGDEDTALQRRKHRMQHQVNARGTWSSATRRSSPP